MPQKITLAEVKEKAREYYDKGKLLAQSSEREHGYDINGFRCAIGAALSKDTCDRISKFNLDEQTLSDGWSEQLWNSLGTEKSSLDRLIKFAPKEKEALMDIQNEHDAWLTDLKYNPKQESRSEKIFFELITA